MKIGGKKIHAVNTGARIVAIVKTPGGLVDYEGMAAIDGVPETAAPVALKFMNVVGSVTGSFLPTGNIRDTIDGVQVTCMDVTMPMVIAQAADFGLTGYESRDELDANRGREPVHPRVYLEKRKLRTEETALGDDG